MTDSTTVDDELLTSEPKTAAKSKTSYSDKEPGKGVVLVTCADPTILAVTLAAIANGIHTNGTIADLSVRPVTAITFIHVPGSRDAESVTSYASRDIHTGKLMAKPFEHCRRFDPLCPGGVPYMMRHLTPGTCVFAVVDYRDLKRDDAIAALVDLNAEAVERNALVVVYVQHTKKQDVTWLRDYCAAAVDVRKCEPGPGAAVAVVLDNLTLASDHVLGVGRVMIEAFREPDGGWTYCAEPFIAGRAVIRLAWYLAYERMKLREIAKVVGIYASNVSRGFQPLSIKPNNAIGIAPPHGWRTRWASWYDLNEQDAKAKPKPADVPSNTVAPQDTSPKDVNASMPRWTSISNEPTKPAALSNKRDNRQS